MAAIAAAPLFTTALTGTVTVGGLLSTALTGFSLLKGIQGGQAAQYGYQAQAEGVKEQEHMERLRAQEEGNTRRERLLQALAAQNSRAGAAGVRGSTVDALQLKSMEDFERDQAQSDLMSQSKLSGFQRQREALKLQGKQAKSGVMQDLLLAGAQTGFSFGTGGSLTPAQGTPAYWQQANAGLIKARS